MPHPATKNLDGDATQKGSPVHIWRRRYMCFPLGFLLRCRSVGRGLVCVSHALGLKPQSVCCSLTCRLIVWCQPLQTFACGANRVLVRPPILRVCTPTLDRYVACPRCSACQAPRAGHMILDCVARSDTGHVLPMHLLRGESSLSCMPGAGCAQTLWTYNRLHRLGKSGQNEAQSENR